MELTSLDEYNLGLAHEYLDRALDCVRNKRRAKAQEHLTESITYYSKVTRGVRDESWEEKARESFPLIMGSQI